jgi:hypothetical protein
MGRRVFSMPVANPIENAVRSFQQNRSVLEKSCKGLTAEEWLESPKKSSNNILWIAGHIVWARSMALKFLGAPAWSKPWLSHFARGTKRDDGAQYPSPDEVLSAFDDVSRSLTEGLENVAAEVLESPAPPNSPPGDGKVSGVINFFAYHETYHVGQVAYLRCWLGHEGPTG